MSSTDDVELLGVVKGDGDEQDESAEQASTSTTPFGRHNTKSESEKATVFPIHPDAIAVEQDAGTGAVESADDPPLESEGSPSEGGEVSQAISALESEIESEETPEVDNRLSEEEAFRRGKAAAMAEMAPKMKQLAEDKQELEELSATLLPLVEELDSLRGRLIHQASEDVADMVLHMARRVVGETLAVHPDALRKLVRDAIDRLPGDDEITVRVRSDDLSVLEEHLPSRRSVQLIADDSLEGGCVVEAQCGEVSASVEAAFSGLRAAIDEWLEDQK